MSHRYGDVVALDELDLEVRAGEVLALLGPNGAGKTTAIGLLLGSLRVQSGEASVFGHAPDTEAAKLCRGAMLQISGVQAELTVAEHVDLFRSYYPKPRGASRLLAMAGLEDLARRRFGKLSGGERQRVMFALALAGDPALVFLDEPTAGLDVESRQRMWREIRGLDGSARTTVLATHNLEEADALADRVAVLHRGRLVAEGTPSEIKADAVRRRAGHRRVRCTTRVLPDEVAALPGVARVDANGRRLDVLTAEAEELVRKLFELDPDLRDLVVSGAGLEEAFLALTRDDAEPERQ